MSSDRDEETPRRQAMRAQIDENLKRVYSTALQEEMPDRFRDLLAQLKARDEGDAKGGSS